MIRDQRDMTGPWPLKTPDEVEAYWQTFSNQMLAAHGYRFAQRQDADGFRTSKTELVAYLNHSRWVADCPMDGCNGGIAVWYGHDKACCLDCGTIFTNIAWPPSEDILRVEDAAKALLIEEEGNWNLHRGETADRAVERIKEFQV